MALEHIAGSQDPLEIVGAKRVSTANETTVEITGPYAAVAAMQPAYGAGHAAFNPCPDGFTVDSSVVTPDGRGGATLTVHCVNYGAPAGQGFTANKTIFNIDMVETVYDLQQHPDLASAAATIAMWLASNPAVQYSGSTGYAYTNADGNPVEIQQDSVAYKFCSAYQAGIKTFSRYYPVIEKVSTWSSLPGVSMVGNSMSGGTVSQFSGDIGKWDSPPITLGGYDAGNWFKSGDRYNQNQDQTYTRREQWTYSPDGRAGPHGWIYQSTGGNNQGGGAL